MYRFIMTWMSIGLTCVHAMFPTEMEALMDKEVDPCNDFYKYACGKWIKETVTRPDQMIRRAVSMMEATRDQLILNDIIVKKHPVLNDFWESCLATERMKEDKRLQKELKQVADATTKETVMRLAGAFSRLVDNGIVKVQVKSDPHDTTMNALHFVAPELTLQPQKIYSAYYFLSVEDEYEAYMKKIMKPYGFSDPPTEEIIDLERDQYMAMIVGNHYKKSIQDVMNKFPLTIGEFLKGSGLLHKPNIHLDLEIYVEESYFEKMEKYLNQIKIEDLKAYVSFLMIDRHAHWLGTDFRRQKKNHEDHKKSCLRTGLQYVPDLIGKYYYRSAFDAERKENVLQMVKLIQDAMRNRISVSKWLDKNTQSEALAKLDKILIQMGESKVSNSYPSTFSRDDYLGNMYTLLTDAFDKKIKKIGQRVNREEWEFSPAIVNAFYSPEKNSMEFPAAYLQPPMFNGPKVHPARNFGAIGAVIGHELTHAFDYEGRKFDGEGKKRNWWDASTSRLYDLRAHLFKTRYSQYQVHAKDGTSAKLKVDLTLDEDIADNGGLSLAWDAYRDYVTTVQSRKKGVEDHVGDRMFFLAYAQSRCSASTDEVKLSSMETDVHSPDEWRVNGALMNNADFSQTFQCKADTRMNPIEKTRVW